MTRTPIRRASEAMRPDARLHELSVSLTDLVSELRLDRLLAKITRHAQTALGGDDFALLIREGAVLRCQSSSGLRAPTIAMIERWANTNQADLREPLIAVDEPGLNLIADRDGVPLRSVCAVPLTYRSRDLGTMIALAPGAGAFDDESRGLLQSYASQVAVAMANAQLFQVAEERGRRDPLTGLLNHREFHEALGRSLEGARRNGSRMSIVLFDLDRFKQVNDTAGHEAGDRVLCAVGQAIAAVCRTTDASFRIGGDEFAVLLRGMGEADANRVGERVAAAVTAAAPRLGISFGAASWPHDGPTKSKLLAAADRRLYRMKEGVPSDVDDDPRPSYARQRERLAVASRLSAALAPQLDTAEIARVTVDELHHSFDYYLAVIQRLDPDEVLRVVAAAGPLAEKINDFLAFEQPIDRGVNGRVARSGEPIMVRDTREDSDYLQRDPTMDPLSELSVPIRVAGRIWGVLNLEQLRSDAFNDDDMLLVDTVAAQVGAAIHRNELFAEVEGALSTTLGMLSDALERKDEYTARHAEGVADLAERVGIRYGFAGRELRTLRYAALLHDIGKIGVPSNLLTKPGPLSPDEFEEVKRHAVVGAEMLSRIPFFEDVHPIVRATHERWDGDGYPDGLAGDEIPLGARIVFACDAFHAMTSDRPYRQALSDEEAVTELRRVTGTQFDPDVVRALIGELEAEPASS